MTDDRGQRVEKSKNPQPVTLITGGTRSGKSRHALTLASGFAKKVFIATAEPLDEEMRKRINLHRQERGDDFETIEEPLDLAGAVKGLHGKADIIIIDCLTLWLNNLMFRFGREREEFNEIDDFLKVLESPPCRIIIVTNEVGMGIIPADPLTRRFRELAGGVNQRVAQVADRVIFMVSGIPVTVKIKN